MKKIISILSIILTLSVSGQNTGTRFGIPPADDNTGRTLTYAIITQTDLTQAALDTITIAPNAWETFVTMRTGTVMVNVADSVCYKFSSTSAARARYRVGDIVTISVSKGTGNGRVKFGGSQFTLSTASSAIALNANKSMIIRFRWNGRTWIEESRVVQP